MTRAAPPTRVKELSTLALLGLDRSPDKRPPAAVLNEIAAVALRAKAGWRSAGGVEAVEPCPTDECPLASSPQQALLERILSDPDGSLLEEWATLALARGVRASPATAPAVLEWWSRQTRRSEAVFAALGSTGPWLADLNPAWRKPVVTADVPPDADARWETGTGPERAALLTAVRRADPSRALAMVRSSWNADGADERRKFVEAIAETPTMADESFLEAALDDRSKLVRQAAAKALSVIDGSRLVGRVESVVRASVRMEETKKGILRKVVRTLVIEPPKTWNVAWERDGFEEKPATKIGQRAWWLQQALALYGPRRLAALLGMEYAPLFEALSDHEYGNEVIAGLREWSPARNDEAWLAALLGHDLSNQKTQTAAVLQHLQGLSTPVAERLARAVTAARSMTMSDIAVLGSVVSGPWSGKFTREIVVLAGSAGTKGDQQWWLGEMVRTLASKGAVEAAGTIEKMTEGLDEKLTSQPSVRASLDRLRLRQDMHKEFAR